MGCEAMQQVEVKSPISAKMVGSEIHFSARVADSLGSPLESPTLSSNFLPSTPPLALISSMAISTECLKLLPYSA